MRRARQSGSIPARRCRLVVLAIGCGWRRMRRRVLDELRNQIGLRLHARLPRRHRSLQIRHDRSLRCDHRVEPLDLLALGTGSRACTRTKRCRTAQQNAASPRCYRGRRGRCRLFACTVAAVLLDRAGTVHAQPRRCAQLIAQPRRASGERLDRRRWHRAAGARGARVGDRQWPRNGGERFGRTLLLRSQLGLELLCAHIGRSSCASRALSRCTSWSRPVAAARALASSTCSVRRSSSDCDSSSRTDASSRSACEVADAESARRASSSSDCRRSSRRSRSSSSATGWSRPGWPRTRSRNSALTSSSSLAAGADAACFSSSAMLCLASSARSVVPAPNRPPGDLEAGPRPLPCAGPLAPFSSRRAPTGACDQLLSPRPPWRPAGHAAPRSRTGAPCRRRRRAPWPRA